jgi:hypothetical protein
MSENRLLRRTFGTKREATGGQRKLLKDLYCSQRYRATITQVSIETRLRAERPGFDSREE